MGINSSTYQELLERYRIMSDDPTGVPRQQHWLSHSDVDAAFWDSLETDYPAGTVDSFTAWLAD